MGSRQARDARPDDRDPHDIGVRTPVALRINRWRAPTKRRRGRSRPRARRWRPVRCAGCRRRRPRWRRRRRCRPGRRRPATARGSPPRAAASARPAPITKSRPPSERREHGRRRAVGADPAARDRGRRGEQRDADEGAARRRTRSRGWTAASRNPSGAVYRARAMRTLGATGLSVSPVGLGLAALGRPGYINLGHAGDVGDTDVEAMERHAHAVLDAAYEGGVRYFDAARSYGRAEAFLASWLGRRGLSRGDVTVGSKWGYTYTADWRVDVDEHEVKDLSVEHAAPPARRDARAHRRAPRALPDPLGHDRERRPRRRGGARGARAAARGGRPRSASPPPDRARPRRSSTRSRSAASTPCRRPGTCTSARPPPRWPPRTRPGWA